MRQHMEEEEEEEEEGTKKNFRLNIGRIETRGALR